MICKEECERPVQARGMCLMHYKRWRKTQPAGVVPRGPKTCIVCSATFIGLDHATCCSKPCHAREGRIKSIYNVDSAWFKEQAVNGCHAFGTYDDLCIDHCHETGAVRGILCGLCNKALGQARDSVEVLSNLITYLHRDNFPTQAEAVPDVEAPTSV